MPTFEYRCNDCGAGYEVFFKVRENDELIICPSCGSKEGIKQFSAFATSNVEEASFGDCGPGGCSIPAPSPCAGGMCGLN